jgi:hypothetical protein
VSHICVRARGLRVVLCVCGGVVSVRVLCACRRLSVRVSLLALSTKREGERETEREREGGRERQRKREICRCLNASPMRLQPRPCNTMQQGLPCVHIPPCSLTPAPPFSFDHTPISSFPPPVAEPGRASRERGQQHSAPRRHVQPPTFEAPSGKAPSGMLFCFPSYFLLCCSPCLSRLANTISHT